MQRTLLILALVAASGTAGAQTISGQSDATGPASINQAPSAYGAETANVAGQPTGRAAIAQKRIEANGYRDVRELALGSDGLWHGRALRGNMEVHVTVDRRGNVSQQ